jgi:hypothetical protein
MTSGVRIAVGLVGNDALLPPTEGVPMNRKVRPPLHDPDWARLLATEQELEADIAAAQAQAGARVAQARNAAASSTPDPVATECLAAAQERADLERQRSELEQISAQADARVRALTDAPAALIDALAKFALDALLTGDSTSVQR